MPMIRKSLRVLDVHYLRITKLPISQISHNNRRQIALMVTNSKVLAKNSYWCRNKSGSSKTKESMTFQKLGFWDFWQIANCVFNKGKSAIPPPFNSLKVLSSASNKAKLFAENDSKNSNLNDSGISITHFPSRTNLKLHNVSITPKMFKKVILNLDSSKASGPDSIPAVVLKNC